MTIVSGRAIDESRIWASSGALARPPRDGCSSRSDREFARIAQRATDCLELGDRLGDRVHDHVAALDESAQSENQRGEQFGVVEQGDQRCSDRRIVQTFRTASTG